MRMTKNSASASPPLAMDSANAMVARAMSASGSMMSALRFQRSAHTPPNSETIACGRAAHSVVTVMTAPESVRMTRCQTIAYCTTLDPMSESACPASNNATRVRHDCTCVVVMMVHFLDEAAVCAHARQGP